MINKFSKKASDITKMISTARSNAQTLAQEIKDGNPNEKLKKDLIKIVIKIENEIVKAESEFKSDFMKLYKNFKEFGGKTVSGNKLDIMSPAYHVDKTKPGLLGFGFDKNHKNPRISNMDSVINQFQKMVDKLEENKKVANAQKTSQQIANAAEAKKKAQEAQRAANIKSVGELQKKLNSLQSRTGASNRSRFNSLVRPQANRLRNAGIIPSSPVINRLNANEQNVVKTLLTNPSSVSSAYNNRLRNIVNRVVKKSN